MNPFATGGLKDTLEKLRQAIDNLANGNAPLGSASGGMNGPGGPNPVGMNPGAGGVGTGPIGLASVQSMARKIQGTTVDTARAFAVSLGQVQQKWKASVGQFGQSWTSASTAFQGKFNQAATKVAANFQRAFDASIGRAMHGVGKVTAASVQSAHRVWSRSVGFGVGAGKTTVDFAKDFFSAWKHAAPGGIPVGGLGATWGQNARFAWQGATGWAGRKGRGFARGLGRGASGFARGAGRRFRHARIRASRAFNRTGSIKAMAGAGINGFMGKGAMAGLGNFGIALAVVTTALKKVQEKFEETNAGNRHLSGYSGNIAAAFGQLALGDQQRNIKMARATEGSAVTLANLTNQSRDIQGSFDRLNAGVSNRIASAGAVVWNGMMKPWAMGADQVNDVLNRVDPKGDLLARAAAAPGAVAAGAGGFLGALGAGGNLKDAFGAAKREAAKANKDALGGVAPKLDPAADFFQRAQNMGPIRPARFVQL